MKSGGDYGDCVLTSEHIARLILSQELTTATDRHGIPARCLLFEILFAPESDDEFKHYIPSIDVIIFSDGDWIASYRLLDNGDVLVSNVVQDTYP